MAASGVTATVAAGAALGWFELIDRARTDPLPTEAHVLVMLTLYGGNDGLNTVISAADPAYQQARLDLAYAEHEVLALGEGLGLNPGITGLKKLWDDRHLAIVRGVSYPNPTTATSGPWGSGRPPHPPTRYPPAGWVAGSMPPAPTHCSPSRSAGAAAGAGRRNHHGRGAPTRWTQPAPGSARPRVHRTGPTRTRRAHTASRCGRHRDPTCTAPSPRSARRCAPGRWGALAAQFDIIARCIEIGAPSRGTA